MLTTLLIYSYTIIKDLEGKSWLIMKTAGNDLWPKLLHRYSTTGPKSALPMVKGVFTAASTSSTSTSSAGASSAAPARARGPPTRVKVTKYTANGQLCYSWKSGGEDSRSYAKEWTSIEDDTGKLQLLHRAKNLISVPP